MQLEEYSLQQLILIDSWDHPKNAKIKLFWKFKDDPKITNFKNACYL